MGRRADCGQWNLALWAEQGYIVVAPNITGSTGFGLDYTEGMPFPEC